MRELSQALKLLGRLTLFIVGVSVLAMPWDAARSAELALIDEQLEGHLDFRQIKFKVCFEEEICRFEDLEISALRHNEEKDTFVPAKMYWDPVDGLGVSGGPQNDEIDVDERLVVRFVEPRQIKSVWLSDLFVSEHQRYGGGSVVGEDLEYARIEWALGDELVSQSRIVGEEILPDDPFNDLLAHGFQEDGDLRQRILVDEETIRLIIQDEAGKDVLIDAPIEGIDEAKRSLFEGIPTVEVDITDIIREFIDVPLFAVGSENADRVTEILDEDGLLEALRLRAQTTRLVSDLANGEISTEFDAPLEVDSVVFQTPFDTSNDYSVAGFVFWNDAN